MEKSRNCTCTPKSAACSRTARCEEVLSQMRQSDPPLLYIVGTPKGRLSKLESQLVDKPWQEVRAGVQVKLLTDSGERYILAQSVDRVNKERAMRRRQLKSLWGRLKELRESVFWPPASR